MKDILAALASFFTHPVLIVMSGGAVGTGARYAVSKWFEGRKWSLSFPWGTFVINVTGSFILAAAFVLILKRLPPERVKWFLFIGTGFCGGYTTFSTFSVETFELAIVRKQPLLALAYAFGSVVAGFVGVALGWGMVEMLWPRAGA